jgi:RNA polymerase sigma-70 factor (ECF subfamily)
VRRQLGKLGVGAGDLDDLVQEVFLVAHELGDDLARVRHPDAWLREVSRRVAAGYRRRAHRRREIAYGEPPEPGSASPVDAQLEEHEAEERLHLALERLDEESRDLVALRELGNLPLTEVASLVAADRKTVSKRLSTALRRLASLFANDEVLPSAGPASGVRPSTRPSAPPTEPIAFRQLIQHSDVNIALIGTLLIAAWPGPPTLEALELLDAMILKANAMCHSSVGYLAVVEATTRPPTLKARQKITQMVKDHAEHFYVYTTAIEGGGAWIARPIMTALFLLARPPFPTHFTQGAADAAGWLGKHWRSETGLSAQEILNAVERLRRVR